MCRIRPRPGPRDGCRAPPPRRRSDRARGDRGRLRSAAWTWKASDERPRNRWSGAIVPSPYARIRSATSSGSTRPKYSPCGNATRLPANRSPPTCVLSQTASRPAAAAASASGRPRSAQQGSRRPWVQTTNSGAPARSPANDARSRGSRWAASSIRSSTADPSHASRVSTAKQISVSSPYSGKRSGFRISSTRAPVLRSRPRSSRPSPAGSRASRSPSRPHGPGCSISTQ